MKYDMVKMDRLIILSNDERQYLKQDGMYNSIVDIHR